MQQAHISYTLNQNRDSALRPLKFGSKTYSWTNVCVKEHVNQVWQNVSSVQEEDPLKFPKFSTTMTNTCKPCGEKVQQECDKYIHMKRDQTIIVRKLE